MNKKNRPVDNLLNAANNVLKNVILLQKRANELQNVYTDVARQWRQKPHAYRPASCDDATQTGRRTETHPPAGTHFRTPPVYFLPAFIPVAISIMSRRSPPPQRP